MEQKWMGVVNTAEPNGGAEGGQSSMSSRPRSWEGDHQDATNLAEKKADSNS